MKKVILLAGITLALTVAVAAQTKVSKQIKVLDWLNVAVVDGNQVEGGLHTYDKWATLNGGSGATVGVAPLKLAQIKLGMLVTITSETDASLNGTFRLKKWATNTALPLLGEWEHVGDLVIVADISTRDALIVTDGSKVSLAAGTTVVVKSNAIGVTESFIYAAGLFDANGDGLVKTDGTDNWYSPNSSTSANAGYVFISQGATPTATPVVDLTNGVGKTQLSSGSTASTPATIAVGTDARITTFPITGVDFSLTVGDNVPVVALPATWNNPTFYLYDGTTSYQLTDCWVKSYQTIDNIKYQVWVVDNSFLKNATGTLSLQVR